jgi:benzoylformate decarboxylase
LSKQLSGHDLIIVVGAPVFRYYPWVPGDYIPKNARLLQVTDDPNSSSKAVVGDSLVSDSKLFFEQALALVEARAAANFPRRAPPKPADRTATPLLPHAVIEVLRENAPADFVMTQEAPTVAGVPMDVFRINKQDTYYTFASGALGWNLPAAVGLALGERRSGRNRPVISLMGDGSFQYSVQGVYTGVQHGAHVVAVVFQNEEYGILKQFAVLEKTPNVPGLDLPGLDIVALGKGYGAHSVRVETLADLASAFQEALAEKRTSVIVVPVARGLGPLLDSV